MVIYPQYTGGGYLRNGVHKKALKKEKYPEKKQYAKIKLQLKNI